MAIGAPPDVWLGGHLSVSRVRNAGDFLLRLRRIRDEYDRTYSPTVAAVRAMYAGTPEQGVLDLHLEAHVRAYIVNAFLAALNWRLDVSADERLPNLVPE